MNAPFELPLPATVPAGLTSISSVVPATRSPFSGNGTPEAWKLSTSPLSPIKNPDNYTLYGIGLGLLWLTMLAASMTPLEIMAVAAANDASFGSACAL